MFIITARIPKRRLIAGTAAVLFCLMAAIAGTAMTLSGRAAAASAEVKGIRGNDERVEYLAGLGWQVSPSPIATEELLVPETFDDSYAGYLDLQREQGFDLTRYCGERVKRYTYEITNYPTGETGVQAALLIYRNRVIGGQVQAADGSFLHGLARPAEQTWAGARMI